MIACSKFVAVFIEFKNFHILLGVVTVYMFVCLFRDCWDLSIRR